jgi:hypothetical protein
MILLMKFPTTILLLFLARCSINVNADEIQLPNKSGGDDDPRTGPSAGGGAAVMFDGGEDDNNADTDDGEARHRIRMVRPVISAASSSSSSETATDDQEDYPRHLHRFHRTMGGKDHRGPAAVEDDDDVIEREVPPPPLRTSEGEESSSSKGIQTTSMAGAAASYEEDARHGDEEGANGVPSSGNAKDSKRLWGAAAAATTTAGSGSVAEASVAAAASTAAGNSAATLPSSSSAPTTQQNVRDDPSHHNQTRAFVVPKSKVAKSPPDGYELSARVFIDPRDRLAHFDPTPQRIPYWDCGYSGSTTSPLPLKSAYFRHALTGATSWSGTDGKHAVLVVTLSPIAMDLNSGETREFQAGSVILLEDVLIAGHKMRPVANNSREGVSVLFLTLPYQFVHTGREHISLPASFLKPVQRDDPCPNEHAPVDLSGGSSLMNETDGAPAGDAERDASSVSSINLMLDSSGTGLSFWRPRNVRRGLLAVFGLSLSSLAADFLAKTAPLWLAVGVGGTCFVAAGTWAMAVGGDALWMAVELQLERRKLGATSVDANLILEDEAETA